MLITIILAHIRVKRNIIFTKKYFYIWFIILGIILPMILFGFTALISSNIISVVRNKVLDNFYLFFITFYISVALSTGIYIYIFGTQFNLGIKWQAQYFLPAKKYYYYISDLIYSLIDLWPLFLIIIFYSIIISLNIFTSLLQYILVGLFFTIFILQIYLGAFIILGFFELIANVYGSRLLKLVFMGCLLFLLIFLIVSPYILSVNIFENAHFFTTMELLKHSPFGLSAVGLKNIMYDENYILSLFIHLIYLNLLYLLFYQTIRKINQNDVARKNLDVKLFTINRLAFLEKIFPLIFAKEIIYLFGSIRIRSLLIASLLLTYIYLSNDFISNNNFSFINILIISLAPIAISSEFISVWLYESNSSRFYFCSSINFSELIFFKNLVYFIFICLILCGSAILGYILKYAYMTMENVLFSFVLTFVVFWLMMVPLNYIAFTWPKKVLYNSIFSKSTEYQTTLLIMITYGFIILVYYLLFYFNPFIVKVILGLSLVTSTMFYRLSLPYINKYAFENRENFVNRVL